MPDCWTLRWIAGPDAGGTTVVGRGSHVVGRAAGAAIRCDDPALESHHVLFEVTADGVSACQLTGRLPVRLDGVPLVGVAPVGHMATLEVGHSLLAVIRGDLTAPGSADNRGNVVEAAGRLVLVRRPRAAPVWSPQPVQPLADHLDRQESTGGLLPAMLALGGSGLLAALVHQPMFLLFGAIGAVAALGTWGGQRISIFRGRRSAAKARADELARFERELTDQRSLFTEHRRANDSTPASARSAITGRTRDLWARRSTHPDAFAVSIGLGVVAWTPTLADRHGARSSSDELAMMALLPDLPMVADVGGTCRLAVRGDADRTSAVARSILLQLAAQCGPADLRFVVVTRQRDRWRWLEPLPQATTAFGEVAVIDETELADTLAELAAAPALHVVVITDLTELLSTRTSPLRRALNAERSIAVLALVAAADGIPHVCTSLLDISGPKSARWHADAALASLPEPAHWSGIGEAAAAALAELLRGLVDPEDALNTTRAVPRAVSLMLLVPATVEAISDGWSRGGSDPAPRTPIGIAADGVVDIDLGRDGPHALLAGTTGSGKSELLRSLVVGLAVACSPEHLNFVLIDYKGGATFDACAELPHVVGVVTDLDDHLASRALRSLHAELRRREQLLREVGATDLGTYRRAPHGVSLPRLVVVVDEFATLVAEQPQFLHALVGIAQRGRSLGVHLILATQRPNGVISDDIRANTNLRVALRLHDPGDALDVVGDRAPAAIPRGIPGRAVVRLGPEEVVTFQAAQCTVLDADGTRALDRLVAAVRSAADATGARELTSPWLPPLPTELAVYDESFGEGVVGLVDDPDRQRMVPLRWQAGDGHLLLVGAAGSGTTSTLVLLGSAAIAARVGAHVWAIDGRGDPALDALARSPWCGGIVRLHERERLIRLLNRLGRELASRIAQPTTSPEPIVLLIDGFELVRACLDDLETTHEYEVLDTIVALGAAHSITVVAAFDRVAAIPSAVLSRCAERWLFHVTDPLDAAGLGVAAVDVPGPRPGRILVTSSGLEAQLMHGARLLDTAADGSLPEPVSALPDSVCASVLPQAERHGDGLVLPIGHRFDDGRVCVLPVPDGEHMLIVGPARSGRSTALRRIVRAWTEANPDGWCGVVAPRCNSSQVDAHRTLDAIIHDIPSSGPVLVAVDDAELVDDVDGVLATLAGSRRHGVMIACAGKPDSLRHIYGHWSAIVRRSRLGIVTSAASDLDGDLLGATLPRRLPITARPGLAWVVANGGVVLTQVASDQSAKLLSNHASV